MQTFSNLELENVIGWNGRCRRPITHKISNVELQSHCSFNSFCCQLLLFLCFGSSFADHFSANKPAKRNLKKPLKEKNTKQKRTTRTPQMAKREKITKPLNLHRKGNHHTPSHDDTSEKLKAGLKKVASHTSLLLLLVEARSYLCSPVLRSAAPHRVPPNLFYIYKKTKRATSECFFYLARDVQKFRSVPSSPTMNWLPLFCFFALAATPLSLGAKLNYPRVLLPVFQKLSIDFTLEVIEGGCFKWYVYITSEKITLGAL